MPPAYQHVFLVLLDHILLEPTDHDDHGVILKLMPGQYCTTIRKMVDICGKYISKNEIERAIKKLILCQFVRQEVRHTKTVLTITHKETYELILKSAEAISETRLRQDRDKIETERKNIRIQESKKKEKNIKKENPEKVEIREWVLMTQKENDSLIERHGQDLTTKMLDILDEYNGRRQQHYASDFHALKENGWVYKKANEELLTGVTATDDRRTKTIDGTIKPRYEGLF